MGDSVTLSIAGVTFHLETPSPDWSAPIRARYQEYLQQLDARQVAWHVTLDHDPALAEKDDAWAIHEETVTRFGVSTFAGWIDLARRRARVSSPTREGGASAVERVLAYICMQALPREHDALLLHGAAIVAEGQGLAFCGPSGAGKTTIARLASGYADVLTDESLALSLASAQPMLLSTPFWGASTPAALIRRVNRRAPLHALCLLEHGPGFDLDLLPPGLATMGLLTTEKVAVERASSAAAWLAVVDRLVNSVPVYRLRFRPTTSLWPFLRQHLRLAP